MLGLMAVNVGVERLTDATRTVEDRAVGTAAEDRIATKATALILQPVLGSTRGALDLHLWFTTLPQTDSLLKTAKALPSRGAARTEHENFTEILGFTDKTSTGRLLRPDQIPCLCSYRDIEGRTGGTSASGGLRRTSKRTAHLWRRASQASPDGFLALLRPGAAGARARNDKKGAADFGRGGGESGIRTHEAGISRLHDFESCAFDQLGHLSVCEYRR